MKREELLKALEELPKVETNNPISAMNSINVDDLMNAIDRLNKIPDYNNLLKENQELKKQLENRYEKVGSLTNEILYEENTKLINQQKKFIKYLEDEIKQINPNSLSISELINSELDNIKFTQFLIYKEILQKYKEIIGDDK